MGAPLPASANFVRRRQCPPLHRSATTGVSHRRRTRPPHWYPEGGRPLAVHLHAVGGQEGCPPAHPRRRSPDRRGCPHIHRWPQGCGGRSASASPSFIFLTAQHVPSAPPGRTARQRSRRPPAPAPPHMPSSGAAIFPRAIDDGDVLPPRLARRPQSMAVLPAPWRRPHRRDASWPGFHARHEGAPAGASAPTTEGAGSATLVSTPYFSIRAIMLLDDGLVGGGSPGRGRRPGTSRSKMVVSTPARPEIGGGVPVRPPPMMAASCWMEEPSGPHSHSATVRIRTRTRRRNSGKRGLVGADGATVRKRAGVLLGDESFRGRLSPTCGPIPHIRDILLGGGGCALARSSKQSSKAPAPLALAAGQRQWKRRGGDPVWLAVNGSQMACIDTCGKGRWASLHLLQQAVIAAFGSFGGGAAVMGQIPATTCLVGP